MAAKRAAASLQAFTKPSTFFNNSRDPLLQCLTPILFRSMATEASISVSENTEALSEISTASNLARRAPPFLPDVLTTVYKFPTMEPTRFEYFKAAHLNVPLRRDILHRAVIFEGDATRQGTASTKWRNDVHGSKRKIRPQKGTGMARLGHRQSPMLRGGGVAFGPHPRDFSTKLPRKIYDLAWRTALSYRYRRGELIVVEDGADIEMEEPRWLQQIMERNHIGHSDGRSLVVTQDRRDNLYAAFAGAGEQGRAKTAEDVDVKDILELGRIIIERSVLRDILRNHSSDLKQKVASAVTSNHTGLLRELD